MINNTTTPKRVCKKCLLRDMDENEYFDNLHDYMNRIEQELKAEPKLYEERLAICQNCDYLNSGMCGACGCFVELRAYIKNNRCSYNKW